MARLDAFDGAPNTWRLGYLVAVNVAAAIAPPSETWRPGETGIAMTSRCLGDRGRALLPPRFFLLTGVRMGGWGPRVAVVILVFELVLGGLAVTALLDLVVSHG